MKLKKIFFIVFLVILIATIWLIYTNKQTNFDPQGFVSDKEITDSNYKDWKIFTDEEGSFKLKYPSDWMIEDGGENPMIRADIAKDTSIGLQIGMFTSNNIDFDDFTAEYINTFKSDMVTHWNGTIRQISSNSSLNDNVSFNRTAFEFSRNDGEQWYLIEYLWKKEDRVITFQCGIAIDKVQEFEPVLDSIADSFEYVR
ncbi:MAG: hypothetical protein HOD64_11415 [Candidatus Cloacimonetes bacterium]|nr:hypothetical protein [Candidatus Cloacimonadota bacterium]